MDDACLLDFLVARKGCKLGRKSQFDIVIESHCPVRGQAEKSGKKTAGDLVRLRQCTEVAELEGNLLLGVGEDPRTLGR